MLSVTDLKYRSLSEISFTLEDGYLLVLLGENGSGKSTLLQLLYGMLRADSGSIEWNGRSVSDHTADCRQEIAFCSPERCAFAPDISCMENMELFGTLYQNFSKELFLQYCEALELPGERLLQPCSELSEGEQQKALLAFEMAKQPKLLLLDECTATLDPDSRIALVGLLQRMIAEQNTSVLFATHIPEDIEQAADYLLLLQEGKQTLFADCEHVREAFGSLSGVMEDPKAAASSGISILPAKQMEDEASGSAAAAAYPLAGLHHAFFQALRKRNLAYKNPHRFEWVAGILLLCLAYIFKLNAANGSSDLIVAAVAIGCLCLSAARNVCTSYLQLYGLTGGRSAEDLVPDLFARHSLSPKLIRREITGGLWRISLPASLFGLIAGAAILRSFGITLLGIALSWLIPFLWIQWEGFLLKAQLRDPDNVGKNLFCGLIKLLLPGFATGFVLFFAVIGIVLLSLFGNGLISSRLICLDDSVLRMNYSDAEIIAIIACAVLLAGGAFLLCEPRFHQKKYGRKIVLPAGVIWLAAIVLTAGYHTDYREDQISVYRFFQKSEYRYSDVAAWRIGSHRNDEFQACLIMNDGKNCTLAAGVSELSDSYNELYGDDYAWILAILQKLPEQATPIVEDGVFERKAEDISGFDEEIQLHFAALKAYVEEKTKAAGAIAPDTASKTAR